MTHKYAAIVGDVIASRHAGDREQLQQKLEAALDAVNGIHEPVQALAMTIGDEFQGLFATMEDAVDVTLRLRLALMGDVETRCGLGWGELELVTERPPFGQDGPCWWRAREAIGAVERSESSNAVPRTIRTLVRTGDETEAMLNSYLVGRDHIISGWDETDYTVASLFTEGWSQARIADDVGLSQSSVSRRLQGHGILAVLKFRPGAMR